MPSVKLPGAGVAGFAVVDVTGVAVRNNSLENDF